ncbi:las17-binding protein actin regulator domain-containing protein [Sarocladium implicatum]|nr:las17-binding protein actin regulator domain-containing protein [Sarocladium implicatum]
MADPNHPLPPQDPAVAQDGDLPPPPPGPPPGQQGPAGHEEPHPNPLSANPSNVMDDQQRQQQELLDYYKREHEQRLQGGAAQQQHAQPGLSQHDDEYRPPQPPRPTEPQGQQQYVIPQYNPADPAFASSPAVKIPEDPQTSNIGGAAAGNPAPASPTAASPTSPEGDGAHKSSSWSARFSNLGMKAAAPINQLAHKLGSQSFLPETMNKECDKAASIMQSFCKSGVYADPNKESKLPASLDPSAKESEDGIIDPNKEKPKGRVIVTIPPKVIARAVGLAIFTTLRAGFNVTGATGSGILIARLEDGSWGPPSGIQVHSVGGGFSIGVDIYDCVCVINSKEALAAFTNTRVSLGSDLAVTAGPYGAGGAMEVAHGLPERKSSASGTLPPPAPVEADQTLKPDEKKSHRRSLSANAFKPVFSYVKSRGFYAGIRVDGTVVVERKETNAAFYGAHLSVNQIIKGQVPAASHASGPGAWPAGAQALISALRNVEKGALSGQGSPGLPPSDIPPSVSAAQPSTSFPVAQAGPSVSGGAGPGPSTSGEEELPGYDERLAKPATGDYKYA